MLFSSRLTLVPVVVSPAHLRTRRFLVIANALMLSYLVAGPQPDADHEPYASSARRPGGNPKRQSRARNDKLNSSLPSASFAFAASGSSAYAKRKQEKDERRSKDPWDSGRFRKEGDFDPENPQATSGLAKIRRQQEESMRFRNGGSRSSRS